MDKDLKSHDCKGEVLKVLKVEALRKVVIAEARSLLMDEVMKDRS